LFASCDLFKLPFYSWFPGFFLPLPRFTLKRSYSKWNEEDPNPDIKYICERYYHCLENSRQNQVVTAGICIQENDYRYKQYPKQKSDQ
jgi:hypothetical protein